MKLKHLMMAVAATALLAGCGPRSVNLIQVHNNMNRYDQSPAKLEEQYKENKELYTSIMKAVRSRSMAPYPTLTANMDQMKAAVDKAYGELKKIRAARDKFGDYAHSQKMVTSDDQAGWNEYKRQSAEYSAYAGTMNSAIRSFNSANRSFHNLIKTHNIRQTSNDEMREEVYGMIDDFDKETKRMKNAIADRTADMALGTLLGGAGFTVKRQTLLKEMIKSQAPIPLMAENFRLVEKAARKDLRGNRTYWTGPGMRGAPEVVDDAHRAYSKFKKVKDAFAKLEAEFDGLNKQAKAEADAAKKASETPAPAK